MTICACGCGCEPDGIDHFEGSASCACVIAGCACVVDAPAVCEWFAACGNPATRMRNHAVLGDVPICERCNRKVERLTKGEQE